MPARAVWLLATAAAMHPVWSGEMTTVRVRGVGHAGARADIAEPLRLRGGLAGVPASPSPSSRGLAAAQVVELADSIQEAAAALATCAPADMASFATPSAVNRALAAMRAVPASTRASILPALIRNALARVGKWTKGSSIARTLRLLSELHLSAHDVGATTVRSGEGQAPTAPPATPAEPVVALAHALVSQGVLDAGILASFSAASVADALASLVALGFQSNGQVGHAARELPAISADVLASLTAQAAQAGVASVKEGCDLLWACSALRLLSPTLITQVLIFCVCV
jgi:hypothetical protein